MTRLGIAMLSETPTTTIVDTPRLRNTASRSVPPIGPTPCQRRNTKSDGCGPNSGSNSAPGVPGVMSTRLPPPIAKIFALWLEPSPSGRRCTRQCTMRTPAARAGGSSRMMFGTATRRASSASAARPASGPTTAPCTSWVTIAVCAGATSSARSVMRAFQRPAPRRIESPIYAAPYSLSRRLWTSADAPRRPGTARFGDRRTRWTGTASR